MAAFVGPCPEGLQVNHKNGIKTDNRLVNLEYVTPKENIRHAHVVLGRWDAAARLRGEANPYAKLTDAVVRDIRRRYCPWIVSHKDLADEFGVSANAIKCVVDGKTWSHVN